MEKKQVEFKTQPFVQWAGGKRQLLDKLEARIPENYERYYEPFVGGGALFFDIQPQKAVINDYNKQLVNAYRQIKENSEQVIREVCSLDKIPCDKERYYEQRNKYNKKIAANQLDAECAALMIWLNKHCFNALYRVNSKGAFNVSYNNKKTGLSIDVDNVRNIAKYLKQGDIEIRQGDFEAACADVKKGDFVYLDSPYIPISATANFTDYTKDGFPLEDHKRLANLFKRLSDEGAFVMASNSNAPLVHELYSGYNIREVDARRSINRDASKRSGKEVIITNY